MTTWTLPEVAEGQLAGVRANLDHLEALAPFQHFLEAMTAIPFEPGWTFLDIGCGVGAYGALVHDKFSELVYRGTDISAAMVERAQEIDPAGHFEVKAFAENDFDADIVMASAVLDYAGRWDALDLLLNKFKRYAILNRLRITDQPSYAVLENTYAGNAEEVYYWNRGELMAFLAERVSVWCIFWDIQATIVLKRLE